MGGVVTMSIVSFGRGYLSTTPFDKTAWLNRVCRERADGSEFVCRCGYNFGDGSGVDERTAGQHETSQQHAE